MEPWVGLGGFPVDAETVLDTLFVLVALGLRTDVCDRDFQPKQPCWALQ